jgi:spoIIIJ-associated protein
VEEAIEEASRRFNVDKVDLKTEVLEEGSKGFLGIGSKPARVKISLRPGAVADFSEGVLSRLLRGMGLPDKVKVQKDSDGNIVLNIKGPSSGTLIGRHGHTLESLQYLVSKIVQRMTGEERAMIIVDVEDYLERQKDKLKEMALSLAEKAKETGVEIPMRPMSSKDRRVVHLALKDHEHVKTESRGEGLRRKVIIVPKNKAPEVTPEAIAAAEAAGDVAGEGVEEPTDAQPSFPQEKAPSQASPESEDGPEPGNRIPVEKEVDDSIGNRA